MYSDPMFYVQKSRECFTLRILLLVWSYFRLVVSVLWTTVAVISLPSRMIHGYDESFLKDPEFVVTLMMYPVFVMIQLAQAGMLIILIVAGHKKSITLYKIYYIYAIIDFVVYASLIFLSIFAVDYWPISDVYITFNITDIIAFRSPSHVEFVVGFVFLADISLEITLIWLLRKQIAKLTPELRNESENSSPKNMETTSSENV